MELGFLLSMGSGSLGEDDGPTTAGQCRTSEAELLADHLKGKEQKPSNGAGNSREPPFNPTGSFTEDFEDRLEDHRSAVPGHMPSRLFS